MKAVILFGPPGSGKGTQAKILTSKFKLVHLSMGEILRKEIAKGTDLGLKIAELINNGNFVSDELALEIVNKFFNENKDKNGVILDGFPRTIEQAEKLSIIFDNLQMNDVNIINLMVDDSEAVRRLLARAELEGRADDNSDSIKNRIKDFHSITLPVLDTLCGKYAIYDINGIGKADKIHQDISGALGMFN